MNWLRIVLHKFRYAAHITGYGKPRTHPGVVLAEEFMKPLGLSARALGDAIGVSGNRVSDIMRGKRAVSADTAVRLGRYFGTHPSFWLNLQSEHDLSKAEGEHDYSWITLVSVSSPVAQSPLWRADISIDGRKLRFYQTEIQKLSADIANKVDDESGRLSDKDKRNQLVQSHERFLNAVDRLMERAASMDDGRERLSFVKELWDLMFAIADTVSRIERKWVVRFSIDRATHRSVENRKHKTLKRWKNEALKRATKFYEKHPDKPVSWVATCVCELLEEPPVEFKTVYDFLLEQNNAGVFKKNIRINALSG